MANPGKFNSDQLRMYMNNGVPLSHDQFGRKADEDDQQPEKSKNLVLPKMLPDVFSMSFYNSMKKKSKYAPVTSPPGADSRLREESLDRYKKTAANYYSFNVRSSEQKLAVEDEAFSQKMAKLRPAGSKKFADVPMGASSNKNAPGLPQNHATQGSFFPARPADRCNF